MPLAASTPEKGSPPSSYAAYGVVQGEPGAMARMAALTALRSFVILPGAALAGIRGPQLLKTAAYASVGISVLTLVLAALTTRKESGLDGFSGWKRVSRWQRP
jgi:hypothetical protein